jgi:PAS domain S-box-containing protein
LVNDVFRRTRRVFGGRLGWPGISIQLVLALLVVVVTGAAVVSYTRMVTSAAERQMQGIADLAGVFLSESNSNAASVLSSVTRAADVSSALQHPDSPRSKQVVKNTLEILGTGIPETSTVVITDATGRVVADAPALVDPGYDVSARPWFKEAAASPGFIVSPVFRSVITGQYLVTISVPIRLGSQSDGRLLGVIAFSERLEVSQAFVDSFVKSGGVRLSVIDSAGAMVSDGGRGASLASATIAQRIAAAREVLAPSKGWIRASSRITGGSGGYQVISQASTEVALRPAAIFRMGALTVGGLMLLAIFLFGLVRGRLQRSRIEAVRYLEQSRSRMRDLANSSSNVVFQLTLDGRVIFVSEAAEHVLGQSVDELVGSDLIARLEAEGAPDSRTRLNLLVTEQEPQTFAARIRGLSNIPRVVECSLRLGVTDDVTEVWGALQDITSRRSASDQVSQLFQLSEDFMAVIDFDGRLIQVNPVWTAAFDVSAAQFMGLDFGEMFDPGDRQWVAEQLARLVDEGTVITFENRYERDGITRTLFWTAAPDPVRGLIYAIGRDLTEHKELARALLETRDEALEASRLKSEFVATMSHEIRTPMNGVIGLTDLLLGTPLDVTQRRYVEGVRTAGDALLSVINDILDFSKIEAGRLQLDGVDFRLEDVVDDVVTLVRQSSSAKALELTVDYEPGVPFALNGDPGRVRQILLNLAHNAVKFTEEGGVSIRVAPGPTMPEGQIAVIFKVTDTGIGIDQNRLEELFEPFRQADEGAARSYGGTGLGLSICRRLAALMGGNITAHSELGQGATFVAELVFTAAADWGRSVRGRDARGLAVLVVDDNEVNRLVMVTQMSRWGMRPVAAASAAEAMELLTLRAAPAGGYDLAVIDMHMPEIDGLALIRQVRAEPALLNLPVILLSSDEVPASEVALEHGVSARLTKPVQQSALFDALTRVGVPSSTGTASAGGFSTTSTSTTVEFGNGRPSVKESGFQLLLVEDNDINQTVALGILSQLGYQVDVAGDGLQALTMAGQHAYDAILMDCQMPKMDGYAATVELRKRAGTRSTPIIAMTAATFAADRQRCFDSGMDDFIAKPVRAATLQATLNRWLRSDQAADSTSRAPGQISGPPSGEPGDRPGMPDHVAAVRDHVTAARESVPTPGSSSSGSSSPGSSSPGSSIGSPAGRPRIPQPRTEGQTTVPAPETEPESKNTDIGERITELLGDGTSFEVEMVREIIASFLGRTVDLLQRLTIAVAADDADATYLHAHSLAGAGLNLGTLEVVRISREIEADAKAGRPGLSVARLVQLEVALDRARIQLRDLAAALPVEVTSSAD